jgi:peptidylprolyl isomerase
VKFVLDDLRVGSGPAAKVGDEVTVQYVGVEYENGKQIDASWDRGEPFAFRLGSGTVIPGWEKGVPGMKVGGRRRLIIPSRLAYGSGALVFVIDLVAIGGPADERAEREPEVQVPSGPPPKELVIEDLEEGSGAEVKAGDDIVVDYVGVNYRTGEKFESTWERPEPGAFTMGTGELIKGWEEGLKGMKVGGRRELIIPSRLAYEKTGTLIYVIDLVAVK